MAAHNNHGALAPGLAAPALPAGPAAGLAPLGSPGTSAVCLKARHKDEARVLGSGAGFREQRKTNTEDYPSLAHVGRAGRPESSHPIGDELCPLDDGKRFTTLRARLALAGWALRLSATGAADGAVVFFATRWNMACQWASLDAVAEFADRVGAR